MDPESMRWLAVEFFNVGAVKFGSFKLKSGIYSPIYFDLRVIISHPRLMREVAEMIWREIEKKQLQYDTICGVPYTALPVATLVSVNHDIPMVLKRKEAKAYGTGKLVEGDYKPGQRCLILEDVVTTGGSILETAEALKQYELTVTDTIVILDRGQGGNENLRNHGIKMTSVLQVHPMLATLEKEGCITNEQRKTVENFLDRTSDKFDPKLDQIFRRKLIPRMTCSMSKKLLRLMLKKRTNLCLSADLPNWTQVVEVARSLGPYLCVLKVHIDTLNFETYGQVVEFRTQIKELARKFEFLIMEDRKFADIGSTVQKQLTSKPFEINQWADLVTVHSLPGPGVLQCFEGLKEDIGLVVIAEMSSSGNLMSKLSEYKAETLKVSESFDKLVAGFVSQSRVKGERKDSFYLQFTPGVALYDDKNGDGLGQQYCFVDDAIIDRGADIIIVGRGILKYAPEQWREVTEEFQSKGWAAFVQNLKQNYPDK